MKDYYKILGVGGELFDLSARVRLALVHAILKAVYLLLSLPRQVLRGSQVALKQVDLFLMQLHRIIDILQFVLETLHLAGGGFHSADVLGAFFRRVAIQ